ncbi:hypothetical protein BC833DRAFT_527979 [Globomyces pollinis-pini]|nr:hypothetical protein BC833DRAFT_527979 [Globomyces pollinis-pini]
MTKPCRFFSKGTCNKGDACRFSHQQPNKTILNCGNLIVYGKCEYGSNCIYSHSILSKSENVQTVFGSEQEQKVKSYGNPVVEFATLNKPPKTQLERLRNSYCSDDESDLEEQRIQNGGFTDEEVNELLCQGVKPWDEDAWAVLNALNGHFY